MDIWGDEGAEHHLVENLSKVIWVLAAWMLLVLAWSRVLANGSAPTFGMTVVPLLTGFASALVSAAWVRHSQAIFRRLGARRAVPTVAMPYDTDRLGRSVSVAAPDGPYRSLRWIEIELATTDRTKRYTRCR